MQAAVADPGTTTTRRTAAARVPGMPGAASTRRRFGVEIDPRPEVIPAIGAKECIYNLCFAFLDPGDVALASDPGYPVYTGGPLLAGAEIGPAAAGARARLRARPRRYRRRRARPRPADLHQLPEQPDRARSLPTGFFERVVELAREHEILVVHDNAYSETTYDGYVAPSFLPRRAPRRSGSRSSPSRRAST